MSIERLQAQLQEEHARCIELETELEVERTAHNSTAETLVEVQQRLEVTLQVRKRPTHTVGAGGGRI